MLGLVGKKKKVSDRKRQAETPNAIAQRAYIPPNQLFKELPEGDPVDEVAHLKQYPPEGTIRFTENTVQVDQSYCVPNDTGPQI